MGGGSERAERKAWETHAYEAAGFYRGVGGESMSGEDRVVHERMLLAVENAAVRLAAAGRENEAG